MKNLLIPVLLVFLTSCFNSDEAGKMMMTHTIIEKIALDNDCKLTSKVNVSNEKSNPLVLTLQSNLTYKAVAGKILFEVYQELSEADIKYDSYIFKANNEVFLNFNESQLLKINQCKPIAFEIFDAIVSGKTIDIIEHLDPKYFSEEEVLLMHNNMENYFTGAWEYVGIEMSNIDDKYIGFCAVADSNLISITFDISDDSLLVYGLNMIDDPTIKK